jgi:hypothetical protein
MESTGSTVIHQAISQERIVRNSPSANSLAMEIHKITTNGSGVGAIVTKLDKIVACFSGIDGTTDGTAVSVDFDGGTLSATTDDWSYPVQGDNSTVYTVMVFGIFEGS